jgi:hypothetical protein
MEYQQTEKCKKESCRRGLLKASSLVEIGIYTSWAFFVSHCSKLYPLPYHLIMLSNKKNGITC